MTTVLLAFLILPLGLTLQSCTDLDEETFGLVTPEQFYKSDAEILAGLAPIYSQLRSLMWAWHNLSQVSSDETIVPTRGSDWFDGGRWLSIHYHSWDAGLDDLNGAWNDSYTGIARANGLLQILEESGSEDAKLKAEIRLLRAWYYYTLMDLFGNVPVVGDDEFVVDQENPPANESRQFVFDFIESEVIFARDNLDTSWPSTGFGRVTKGAANALLANMYLNAEIFRGELTAGGITRAPAQWQDAVTTANAVINSGQYSLAGNYFDNFSPTNEDSPEAIFVVAHLPVGGLGVNHSMRSTHYNQWEPSPWNGFATIASVYQKWDEKDLRRQIFLVGEQVNFATGEPAFNRQGERLVYTESIADETNATEGEGIRPYKFPLDPNAAGGDSGNDYPFFRLAEMLLIKAEALNEMNGPSGEAIGLLNQLRQRAFAPGDFVPLAAGDFTQDSMRDFIMDERVRELAYEAKRRQDLVRAGKFTEPWEFKTNFEPYRVIFPIPQTQLDSNPNMVQNPGY